MSLSYQIGLSRPSCVLRARCKLGLAAKANACPPSFSFLLDFRACRMGVIYTSGNLYYTRNIVARFKSTGLVTCHAGADYVKSTVK